MSSIIAIIASSFFSVRRAGAFAGPPQSAPAARGFAQVPAAAARRRAPRLRTGSVRGSASYLSNPCVRNRTSMPGPWKSTTTSTMEPMSPTLNTLAKTNPQLWARVAVVDIPRAI